MARIVVVGIEGPGSRELIEALRREGHETGLAWNRRVATRAITHAGAQGIACASPLAKEEEHALFGRLAAALPGLPPLFPRLNLRIPIYARPRGEGAETEAVSRLVNYLFGLAEGTRIAVPAEIEPAVPGAPRLRGLATEARCNTFLFEYLAEPPGGPTLARTLAQLSSERPCMATARLRFPGRGTLSVRGTTQPVARFEGAAPALLLHYDPAYARTRVGFLPSARFSVAAGVRGISERLRSLSGRIARASAKLVNSVADFASSGAKSA